jgi:hypothetical protein
MNNFILSYPCLFLANLYDPVINIAEKKSVQQIKAEIKSQLMATFKKLNLNQYLAIHKKSGKFEFVLCIFFACGFYRFVKEASKNKIQKKFTTKTG